MHSYWRRRYGLTQEEVVELKVVQGGMCALCRKRPAKHVDHDTTAGERHEKMSGDIDAILDDIDEVLEENSEEFVRQYVQKGGE